MDRNFQCQSIFSNHIILEKIIENLPAKYLCSLKCINKLWLTLINKILNNRNLLAWAVINFQEFSPLEQQVTRNYIDLIIESLWAYPKFAIFFVSYNLHAEYVNASKFGEVNKTIFKHIKRKLPPDCLIPYIISDGIIGSNYSKQMCMKLLPHTIHEFESGHSFSFCLFPNIKINDPVKKKNNLHIDILPIPKKDIKLFGHPRKKSDNNSVEFDLVDFYYLKNQSDFPYNAKVVLFFADSIIETPILRHILKIIKNTYSQKQIPITICGALVDNLDISNLSNRKKSYSTRHSELFDKIKLGILVMFIQGDSIKDTILHIIPSAIKTTKDAENNIKALAQKYQKAITALSPSNKSTSLSSSNSLQISPFGFIFSCIGRGKTLYGMESNVETRLFQKHIPHVPLVGLFGNGEIAYQTKKLLIPTLSNQSTTTTLANNPMNTTINNFINNNGGGIVQNVANPAISQQAAPIQNSVLEEILPENHNNTKLDSEKFVYYYSTVICLLLHSPNPIK